MARLTALDEDNARTRADNDELRAPISNLQAGTSVGSSTVDTKLLSKRTKLEGKEEDWTRFTSKISLFSRSLPIRCTSLCVFWGTRSAAGGRFFVTALEDPVDPLAFSALSCVFFAGHALTLEAHLIW